MLKKPFFVSIFVLLFIGLSDYGYAHHRPGHDGGGGGGGGGDGLVYTATLTGGAFEILDGWGIPIELTVTPSLTESELRGIQDIVMMRPADPGELMTWNAVFNECVDLLVDPETNESSVEEIFTGDDNWQIDQAGGGVLRLMNIRLAGINDARVEVDVDLRGDGVSGDPFLPEAGDTSSFRLTTATIHGGSLPGAGPRRSCRRGGGTDEIPLDDHYSVLEITATASP